MLRAFALIAALSLALVACDAQVPPSVAAGDHPATLAGTSWVVAAIGGTAVPRGSQPTIAFEGDAAKGSGGCNSFGGVYRYEPVTGKIRFEELRMTTMACAEAARNQAETAFMQVLGQPSLVATVATDGHLMLTSAAGAQLDLVVAGQVIVD